MIKKLTEKPNAKFRNGSHIVKISDTTKRIVWESAINGEEPLIIFSNSPGTVDNLNTEWELIREPVGFMEAVHSGKRIALFEDKDHEGYRNLDYWCINLDLENIDAKWLIE